MHQLYTWVFEPGFFSSAQVHVAVTVGGVVAVVSAVVGVFTVMRGQSFGGHALGDVSAAGGSGALLLGLSPVAGFVGLGIIGAGVMDMIGVRRVRGRDLATGIVLGAAIGLTALFLYLGTTSGATTGAPQQILFGSIFVVTSGTIPVVVILSVAALATVAAVFRPLLLSTVSPDIAAARGVPVRAVGLLYMLALAVSVGLSSVAVGAVLSTALLIGPAAAALRLTSRVSRALVTACVIGVGATWLGVLLAYDSFYWGSSQQGLPVSFFIVAVIFAAYLASGLPAAARAAAGRRGTVTPMAGRPRLRPDRRLTRAGSTMFTSFMTNTWIVATIVAVVAGVVGFFVVLRGSAFPAHAIPKGAFAGAAGAALLGINTLIGLGVFSLLGALGIGSLGRRGRHDVVTALTLVMMLALGAAFLSRTTEYEPEIFSLLFGEVLGVASNQILPVALLGLACIAAIAALYRPLMLSSVVPEIAEARGVRGHRMEICFLIVVALATAMTVPVVGALLIFSLMIGPPAAARSLTSRPVLALIGSVVIALVTVWVAIAASYLYNWPVGFFVGALGALSYGIGRGWAWHRTRATAPPFRPALD